MIQKIDCHNTELETAHDCQSFIGVHLRTDTVCITEGFSANARRHAQDEPRPVLVLYLAPEQARALAEKLLDILPPPKPTICPECKREL